MLPVEVAGGIKRDAVKLGCKARFSFVSVKASQELENYFLQEIATAVSGSVALGDEYQSFLAFSKNAIEQVFLVGVFPQRLQLLYPYISNGRKPNVTKGSKNFALSPWALLLVIFGGSEPAGFQRACSGVIFILVPHPSSPVPGRFRRAVALASGNP